MHTRSHIRCLSLLLLLLCTGSILTSCSTTTPQETESVSISESGAETPSDTSPATDEVMTEADTEADTSKETEPDRDPVLTGTEPYFSTEGGFYTDALTLTLTLPEGLPDGSVIRYTTNGSAPTRSSTVYRDALSILKSADSVLTLRAACFDQDGNRLGAVVTQTYLRVAQREGMWTIAISVAEKDLNAMTSRVNEKIEKPAHVEIVTPEGERVISQDAGLRLFGGSSRSLAQKSFKLIARKDGYFGEDVAYTGKGSFAYPLFSDRIIRAGEKAGQVLGKYDSFILRNGGNDSLLSTAADPTAPTLIRDGLSNNFAQKWAPCVDVSLSQFAIVYINGEYYGILDMRENLNEDYVKRVYDVDDDDVVILKSELDTSRHCFRHDNGAYCRFCNVWFYYETDENEVAQAAMQEWIDLCKQATTGLFLDSEAQAELYASLSEKIDMESFLQYMALNLYLCNTDWPYNNVKFWKYTGEPIEGIEITDGKWRFMTRDMDMCFGRYSSPQILPDLDSRADRDTFWRTLGNYLTGYEAYYQDEGTDRLYPDSLYVEGLFAFCLQNDDFCEAFATYAKSLASEEAQTDLLALYDDSYTVLKTPIKAHINRWKSYVGTDQKQWSKAAGKIKTFIKDRPAYFLTYLDRMLEVLDT